MFTLLYQKTMTTTLMILAKNVYHQRTFAENAHHQSSSVIKASEILQ